MKLLLKFSLLFLAAQAIGSSPLLAQGRKPLESYFFELDGWTIRIEPNELVYAFRSGKAHILTVKGVGYNYLFFSMKAPPKTPVTIPRIIAEAKGQKTSLKLIKDDRDNTIFFFQAKDENHWYSTLGGHLSALVENSKKLNISGVQDRVLKVAVND